MKTLVKVIIVAALCCGGGFYAYTSANAVELDGDVGTSFSDVRSFRGVKQSDDTVNASVDVGTAVSDQFNVGLGIDSFSTLEEGQTDELRTNLSVGYGINDLLSVSLGYIDYNYQGSADADEVEVTDEGIVEVTTAPEVFDAVHDALKSAGLTVEFAELLQRPSSQAVLDDENSEKVMGLIDALDELDDVQEVFTNASLAGDLLSEE